MKTVFSKMLKKARKEKGLSRDDLAGKLRSTERTVEAWEQGRQLPGAHVLLSLPDILECSLDYLTGRIKEKTVEAHHICKYTGLSEKAVSMLQNNHKSGKGQQSAAVLSDLLENPKFWEVVENIGFMENIISSGESSRDIVERARAKELNISLEELHLHADACVFAPDKEDMYKYKINHAFSLIVDRMAEKAAADDK